MILKCFNCGREAEVKELFDNYKCKDCGIFFTLERGTIEHLIEKLRENFMVWDCDSTIPKEPVLLMPYIWVKPFTGDFVIEWQVRGVRNFLIVEYKIHKPDLDREEDEKWLNRVVPFTPREQELLDRKGFATIIWDIEPKHVSLAFFDDCDWGFLKSFSYKERGGLKKLLFWKSWFDKKTKKQVVGYFFNIATYWVRPECRDFLRRTSVHGGDLLSDYESKRKKNPALPIKTQEDLLYEKITEKLMRLGVKRK